MECANWQQQSRQFFIRAKIFGGGLLRQSQQFDSNDESIWILLKKMARILSEERTAGHFSTC
jgi:hypothetical protein